MRYQLNRAARYRSHRVLLDRFEVIPRLVYRQIHRIGRRRGLLARFDTLDAGILDATCCQDLGEAKVCLGRIPLRVSDNDETSLCRPLLITRTPGQTREGKRARQVTFQRALPIIVPRSGGISKTPSIEVRCPDCRSGGGFSAVCSSGGIEVRKSVGDAVEEEEKCFYTKI